MFVLPDMLSSNDSFGYEYLDLSNMFSSKFQKRIILFTNALIISVILSYCFIAFFITRFCITRIYFLSVFLSVILFSSKKMKFFNSSVLIIIFSCSCFSSLMLIFLLIKSNNKSYNVPDLLKK